MANILIVDDEQSYRQLLTLVFEEQRAIRPHRDERSTGPRARAEEPADIIISDVRMPDMDGIEMLRAVRETRPMSASC